MDGRTLLVALLLVVAGCGATTGPGATADTTTPPSSTTATTTGPPSTTETTPTTFPPETTVAVPDEPANDSRAAAVTHAVAVEEARTFNEMVRSDPNRDLHVHCRAARVNETASGYHVGVECSVSGQTILVGSLVSFTGHAWGVYAVNDTGTHVVRDGDDGAAPWRE